MKPLIHAQLVNGPLEDPALYVEILWEHRALLFDLGKIENLRPSRIQKISNIFVSHTHIDHFIGFDCLVRLMLNREKTLRIYGPLGFLANVEGKLRGYTWNLTSGYSFAVEAAEVGEDLIRRKIYRSCEQFAPQEESIERFHGVLLEEPQMEVIAVQLDHFVPSLAFALKERFHINIHRERLARMGLTTGPWLMDLKQALWRGEKDDYLINAVPEKRIAGLSHRVPIGELRPIVTITPGQKIVYVADCSYSPENIEKIIRLAHGADRFYCEAAFLDQDRERAKERGHLTARQAGDLARRAKVKHLEIFHFSPKYEKEFKALYREAEEAFGNKFEESGAGGC